MVPISPVDSMFLALEAAHRPMNIGALLLLNPPMRGNAMDTRAMFAAALSRGRVAEFWRRRPHRSLGSFGQWCWHTDTDVDLGYHVQFDALPQPADMAELQCLVADLHTRRLDRSRPLWRFHLIEGLADGRYAIYVKIHHALADGVSAMRFLQRSFSADPDQRGSPAFWEVVGAEPDEDCGTGSPRRTDPIAAGRGLIHAVGKSTGVLSALGDTAWRALQRRGGPLTLAAPHTPLNVPIGKARVFAGCAFPTERLRRVANHTGATVNDVVLAMCAGALRRYLLAHGALPDAPLIAMVPVSLRHDQQPDRPDPVAGNRISTLMCSLATHLADPAARLAAVQASAREAKAALAQRSQLQAVAMAALGAAPLAITMMAGHAGGLLRPPNTMISNIPGPTGALYWNGARLDALYPLSVPVDGQALNITCTTVNDHVMFGMTGCRRAVPAIDMIPDSLGRELDLLDTFCRLPPRTSGRRRSSRAYRTDTGKNVRPSTLIER